MQLNEGLEKLGKKEAVDEKVYEGEVFYGSAIESIRIPSTLNKIATGMFSHCRHLRNVEISNGVEYIGERCFEECDIEEITFPNTLKAIH